MDRTSKNLINLFSRYLVILLLGLGNLYIFYKVLTIPTVHVLNLLISLSKETLVMGNIIYVKDTFFNTTAIEIIPACVAGSAFYLLLALIFTTSKIKPSKRASIIISSVITLFVLNILRMLILVGIKDITSFETVHWIFWNLVSVVLVVGIWIYMVKRHRIKSVPVYSDFKYLAGLNSRKKIKRRKKKKSKSRRKS